MKQKVIGTGLSGMVGSRIVELLGDTYEFEDLSLKTGVDIRKKEIVDKKIGHSKAQVVFHLAAKTDVDLCEKDKPLKEKGEAWQINVLGTENVAQAAEKNDKKMIYISTDFVFDGKKEFYTEQDVPCPINWYGETKYQAEKIVKKLSSSLILRIAFPFRAFFPLKRDFVRAMLERLRQGEKIKAVSNQVITPTFIDDIALALKVLIRKEANGIYHLVGSESLTPHEAVCLIVSQFHLNPKLVSCVKMENYYSEDKAPRPKNLALKNDRIKDLGIRMSTFRKGLENIKYQMSKRGSCNL